MKKIVFAALTAGAILSIVSCQKETLNQSPSASAGKNFIVNITAKQSDTKTVLEGTTSKWKSGDMVTVMYKKTGNDSWQTSQSEAASSSDEFATATFSVTLEDPNTEVSAYAIYPANSIPQSVKANAKIPIAATQYPTGTSFDGNSDVLISKPFTPSSSVSTQFSRASAILKIKIQNATLSGEKLLSLSVTGEHELAGDIQVKLSDHSVQNTVQNPSNTVTAVYTEPRQFTIGESGKYVYLVVKPQTLASGSTLTISGITENFTFTKSIPLLQDIHLNSGHIIPLNIGITSITPKLGWYRVEDASWLKTGDFVVIANHTDSQVMGYTQEDTYRAGLEITVENKKITTFNSEAQMFILETGTQLGSFAYWCNNGNKFNNYLYSGANSNSLTSQSSLSDNSSFIATLPDDGYGTLTGQGANTNKLLRYNHTNTRFCCYGSGQQNVSIYKYYGEYPGIAYGFATYRFNKTEDLIALSITPPSGSTSNLDVNTTYSLGDVSMTVTHGSTNTRIYKSNEVYDLRLYGSGGSIAFDAGSGKLIKRIEFVPNGNSNFGLIASDGSLVETVWTGSCQKVTFSASKTNYLFVVKVFYE